MHISPSSGSPRDRHDRQDVVAPVDPLGPARRAAGVEHRPAQHRVGDIAAVDPRQGLGIGGASPAPPPSITTFSSTRGVGPGRAGPDSASSTYSTLTPGERRRPAAGAPHGEETGRFGDVEAGARPAGTRSAPRRTPPGCRTATPPHPPPSAPAPAAAAPPDWR